MTIHLPEPVERSINAAVESGRFPSVDDAVAAAWRAFDVSTQGQSPPTKTGANSKAPPAQPLKPIWELADDIRKNVPAEEWAKLPADGAAQLDHYLYGSPKRPTS